MSPGGIIFPVMAEIRPFVGALQVDADFKEPVRSAEDGHGKPYLVVCQVEPKIDDAMSMQPNGDDPVCRVALILNRSTNGANLHTPKPRDRLVALYSMGGKLLQDFRMYNGLYATEAVPIALGEFRGRSKGNLLRVAFQSRSHAVRRAG